MGNIIRNRTIRPSSRQSTSTNYRINTKNVAIKDILIVNIDHESKPFRETYYFEGSDVAQKDSIHFKVSESDTEINITWAGAQPVDFGKLTKEQKIV